MNLKFAAAALIVAPAAALAADTIQLTPGRWQVTMITQSVSIGGRPMSRENFEDHKNFDCITPDVAAEPARYFLLPDRERECKPQGTVANGRVAMTGECNMRGMGKMMVTSTGTYEPRSLDVTWNAQGIFGGQPVIMIFVMRGRYLGACRGDETG